MAKQRVTEKQLANLKPRKTLSTEQAKKMGRAGGLKSVKAKKEKKTLTQYLKLLLEQDHTIKDQTKTGSEWLTVSLFQKALKGDIQAQKMIFERLEGMPIQKAQVEVTRGEMSVEKAKDIAQKLRDELDSK